MAGVAAHVEELEASRRADARAAAMEHLVARQGTMQIQRSSSCQFHSGGSMQIGNRGLLALVAVVCLASGMAVGTAVAQATPPAKDSEGISRQPGPEVDLGPDLPGYKLRVTTVTFAPGAVRALHDHKKNPEVTYTAQGKLTEFTKAGGMKEFGPGEMRSNGREVEHWVENHGSEKVVLITAMVVKAP
jgi:quercetin dioxygenase-like cupin family protein